MRTGVGTELVPEWQENADAWLPVVMGAKQIPASCGRLVIGIEHVFVKVKP
jgi:hypothetical protein